MNPRLEKLRARIDDLSIRERGMLFLALVAILFMVWQSMLMDPLAKRQKAQLEKLNAAQQQLSEMNHATQQLVAARTTDPDAENRRAAEQLRQTLSGLESQIKGTVAGLMEPRQMAKMLEDVLTRNPGLVLKKVQSLPAKPLVAEEGVGGTVYQHGLRLELEGSYLDALAYLRALQKMPRAIYWDEVRVVMTRYPTAQITITVHTLSLSEGWIGV